VTKRYILQQVSERTNRNLPPRNTLVQFLVLYTDLVRLRKHWHIKTTLSRSSKVIDFGANRKRIYDLLLVRHSNLGPILHRFGDFAAFVCSWPHPYSTLNLGCSRCTRSPMLGSPSAWALSYLAVILFSKYSNLCENHTSTSQTDRWTDNLQSHNRPLGSIAR